MEITLISANTYPADQGLRTISACLKEAGYKVKIVFMTLSEDYSKFYPNKALNQLTEICRNSKLIGISSMASTSKRAEQIIKHLKKLNIPIVWGGAHTTIYPEKSADTADIVIIGEAEDAMVELADKIEKNQDYSKIKNLIFKKDDKLIINEIRHLEQNLDKYPFADYDIEDHYILEKNKLIPFEERHFNGMIFYQSERGCPHACTYCLNRKFQDLYKSKGKILRSHSVDYIINDLKRIKNRFKTIKTIDIRDEVFFIRPLENIKEFCERYKKEIGLRWKCLADTVTINEEKLKLMIGAGLTDIIIGIQSGSDKLNWEVYKRYIKSEQVIKAAEIINKFNLTIMYDVITTNPYEEKDDILATINLLRKLPKPYFLSVNNLVFFYGSELYDRAIKEKLIKTEKDTAAHLNYWDRWKHIKLKKKNAYLNLILNLMRGRATKTRYGVIPNFTLNILLKDKIISFNLKHSAFTYFLGYFVNLADFIREEILKPIYRSMPTGFKAWYDKVRYRI